MPARLAIARSQPGKMDGLISIFRDCIVPARDKQERSEGTGLAISTTLGQRNDDMTTNEASCCQEEIAKAGTAFAGKPGRRRYAVSAQA